METFVNALNTVGKTFVDFSLSMLIQSAALIVVLLVLDLLLRKKVQAVFRYFLWLLVLAKLMLPTSFSAPTSLAYWLGDRLPAVAIQPASPPADVPPLPGPVINPAPAETIAAIPAPAMAPAAPINNETLSEAAALPQSHAPVPAAIPAAAAGSLAISLSWQAVVFIVWLAVAAAMVLLLLQRFFFVRGLIAQSQPAGDALTGLLDECRARMGLKPAVALKLSPNAASPSVCGLLRPVILLPQDLPDKLPAGRLRAIFLHELAHIKRGDLWVSLIQTLLQIAYFYHPLLWLANAIIRRLREQAVDEMVLVALGEQAGEYPETLLDVSRLSFTQPALSLRLIGVVESKSTLAARIKHILSRPYPKSARLGMAGLLTILTAAAVLLPMAKAAYEEPEFIIKGTVTDAQTGQPIAGAKVGDSQKYNDGKFCTVTDPNGYYEYKTWYEEHGTTAEAAGYQTQSKGFTTKLFGSEKEKVINYELTPQESTAPSPFSATLPNGVTVELIGVCESPSEGKQWWRPDGSLLETVPYNGINVSVPIVSDRRNLNLAVLIENTIENDGVGFRIGIPQSQGFGIGQARKDEKTVPNLQGVLFDLPMENKTADVHVGVSAGQWTTKETCKPDFNGTISTQTMIWNGPITKDNKTVLHVAHMETDLETRIIAVDKSSKIHIGSSTSGGKDTFISAQIIFRLPLSEISEFQFQTRPYQWLTFQNVSLRPDHKTEVQIEIEPADKGQRSEAKANPMAEYLKMMETMMSKPESAVQETKASALPLGMVGTWFFDNPAGDDEQMAIFPDGRIVVLYSNGHRDETRYEDGKVALAEYGTIAEMKLDPTKKIHQYFTVVTVDGERPIKIWTRIDLEPKTELLRPLTESQPNTADASSPGQNLMADYLKMMGMGTRVAPAPSKPITAELPNGVTVELVGFTHWYGVGDGDKLEWYSFNGQKIQMPGVTEADVDGLGLVVALKVIPSDRVKLGEIRLTRLNGEFSSNVRFVFQVKSENIWLITLEEPRKYINLSLTCERIGPWQDTVMIPINYKELFPDYPSQETSYGAININREGVAEIMGTNKSDRGQFALNIKAEKDYYLGNIRAIDESGNTHEQLNKNDLSLIERRGAIGGIFYFDFPLVRLKGIIGKTCRIFKNKVVFQNICLIPGQKSEVKIEIETPEKSDDPNTIVG